MPSTQLTYVLRSLERQINVATQLVAKINQLGKPKKTKRYISKLHHEMIIELAFLRSFLAWERFLEESFILYLLGKKSPTGFKPKRYVLPKNYKHALEISSADASYADWTSTEIVIKRAERFFNRGDPYASSLKIRTAKFNDVRTLRNAIAHSSIYSRDRFRKLVRRELTYYPAGLTPGGFLNTGLPALKSRSFLEDYLDIILESAKDIIP